MMESINGIFRHSIKITLFVLVMMVVVDFINIVSQGKLKSIMKGGIWRQYTISSFLGATPGCLGAFMNVSLYVHGLLSFGAIVGGMIATTGDEAFVMLSLFPQKAILLFGLLFAIGIIMAWVSDKVADLVKIMPCEECRLYEFHPQEVSLSHYFKEHVWAHILKKHLWRVFLWIFFALLFINIAFKYWNLEAFVEVHRLWILLIAVLVAVIPESGPHLVFVVMFAKGLIPFSVLLASSVVQDGHGLLPLLSYTVRDSILIKIFNLVIGVIIGVILYFFGL